MDALIFKCRCCDRRVTGTEEQAELFKCIECGHHEWDKVGMMIEFEQFYYVDDGELVHTSKLTREQKVSVGLEVEKEHR